MPKLNVSESIIIDASVEEVFNVLNNFKTWTTWSPWLIQEPNAKVTIADDAKSYSWEGTRVGSGNMVISNEVANKSINIDLQFIKPWKSKAKVEFHVHPSGDGAKVTWVMHSSLPFFMFWMKKMMIAFIGSDYKRGLLLLKDYVNVGKVYSTLTFNGIKNFEGCEYIGIKNSCSIDDVAKSMSADFTKLHNVHVEKPEGGDMALSIYHKWDMVKEKVEYTAGVIVKEAPTELPEGMVVGSIPATKINSVEHTGPYHHLGNAWSTQMSMMRAKEFKAKKGIHPFELYKNNPQNTTENELITEICFAAQ